MENRWNTPGDVNVAKCGSVTVTKPGFVTGIAEVTLQAYSRRHGVVEESPGARCRARAKPIGLTIVCLALISLAVYWLIVGPIYESLSSEGGDGSASSGRSRGCDR